MVYENLTMAGKYITSREQAQEMGRKGGLAGKGSVKKSLAARLRELRKKGLTGEAEGVLVGLMDDPDFSSLDVLMVIRRMLRPNMSGAECERFVRCMLEWHKVRHGVRGGGGVVVGVRVGGVVDCELLVRELLSD